MSDEEAYGIPLWIKTEFDETLFPEQRTSSVIKRRKKEDDEDYQYEPENDDECREELEVRLAEKEEIKEKTLPLKEKKPVKSFAKLDRHLECIWGSPVTIDTVSRGLTIRNMQKVTITTIEQCPGCRKHIIFTMSKEGHTYARCGCGDTKRKRTPVAIWDFLDTIDKNDTVRIVHAQANPENNPVRTMKAQARPENNPVREMQEQARPKTDLIVLERKIVDLKELCRVLIMRIKAAGGPKRLCACIDQSNGMHFEVVPFDVPEKNQFSVKTNNLDLKMIGSIPLTDFAFRFVDSIQSVEDTIAELMQPKKDVQKNASDECYRCILEDIISRLFKLKQLLSDTHAISVIDVPRLNYELEKSIKPYAHALDSQNIYKTRHITLTNTGMQCQAEATDIYICQNTATAYCSLCKRHLCVMHISHESCFSDECNENCGCQSRRV